MMPGLIVLTRAPRFPQRTACAITRNEFPSFEFGKREGSPLSGLTEASGGRGARRRVSLHKERILFGGKTLKMNPQTELERFFSIPYLSCLP